MKLRIRLPHLRLANVLVISFAVAGFILGYGMVAKAWPMAHLTTSQYVGVFQHHTDNQGTRVWPASGGRVNCAAQNGDAVPLTVDTVNELNNFVNCKLGGSAQEKTGASFIVELLLNAYNGSWSPAVPPSASTMSSFSALLTYLGSQGEINFGATFPYSINSYDQNGGTGLNYEDDAFFNDSGSDPAITFSSGGKIIFAIRRECGNPVGNGNFGDYAVWSMAGHTKVSSPTGGTADNGGQVNTVPSEQLTFTHYLKNNGPDSTSPTHILVKAQQSLNGGAYTDVAPNVDKGIWAASGPDTVVITNTYNVPAGAANGDTICMRVAWTPASAGSGSTIAGTGTCAKVVVASASGSCTSSDMTIGGTINPDPTTTYTLTGVVHYSSLAAAQAVLTGGGQFFIKVTGPNGAVTTVYSNLNVPATAGGNAGAGTLTAGPVTAPATGAAGLFAISFGLSGASPVTCSGTVFVGYTPYFSVLGGDVAAGPDFGSACVSELSGITGENLGSSKGYYGATSQLGAFSLGQITGFATGTFSNTGTGLGNDASGGTAARPYGLSFANTGTDPNNVFGTTFGKDPADDPADNPSFCVPDYAGNAAAGTATTITGNVTVNQAYVNTTLAAGGTFIINGNLQTSGALAFGGAGVPSRVILVVNGDAYINSATIQYANYNYVSGTSTVNNIPRFQLLVNGDIYIDKAASTLTGFYTAQSASGTGGHIYTCATGAPSFQYLTNIASDASPNAQQDANYYTDCSTQLTVYGSVAAMHIELNRTAGNWRTAGAITNIPAEKIVYTPELWLGSQSATSAGTGSFDAITNLPPIF